MMLVNQKLDVFFKAFLHQIKYLNLLAEENFPVSSAVETETEFATHGSNTHQVLSVSTFVASSLGSREFPSEHTMMDDANTTCSSVSTKTSLIPSYVSKQSNKRQVSKSTYKSKTKPKVEHRSVTLPQV